MTINLNLSEYEKALTVLALRTYAKNQLKAAVVLYQDGMIAEGKDASERGRVSTSIADLIDSK